MPNPYFSFKQFTVYQQLCAMKVGIDGVLLGAWTNIKNAKNILDIGTGTGLIALMLAQRSNASIDGIDLDKDACIQAEENIRNSPWPDRIHLQHISLQDFTAATKKQYDLIVSNPPYFINSLKSPDLQRHMARHTDSLTHEELIISAKKLLTYTGRLCIILPINEAFQCIDFALENGLHCTKTVSVIPKPGANPKRLLLEFSAISSSCSDKELIIESEVRHQYSAEFTKLVKDFYLKL